MRKSVIDQAITTGTLKSTDSEPTYSGVLSFLRRKYSKDLKGADVAVVGIPLDLATTNRPGARFGPAAVRSASIVMAWERPYGWDFDPREVLCIIDYGDLLFDFGRPEEVAPALPSGRYAMPIFPHRQAAAHDRTDEVGPQVLAHVHELELRQSAQELHRLLVGDVLLHLAHGRLDVAVHGDQVLPPVQVGVHETHGKDAEKDHHVDECGHWARETALTRQLGDGRSVERGGFTLGPTGVAVAALDARGQSAIADQDETLRARMPHLVVEFAAGKESVDHACFDNYSAIRTETGASQQVLHIAKANR